MKKELRHIDLIDKYLLGHLNPEEGKEVQRLLAEDPEFSKEFEVFKQIYKGVELQAEDKLRRKLTHLYQEYQQEQKKKAKGVYRRLIVYGGAIAASIIVGTALYIFTRQDPQSPIGDDTLPTTVDADTLKNETKDTLFLPKKNTELVEQDKTTQKDTFKLDVDNDEVQLAFSNAKTLSTEAVLKVPYPSGMLTYTFDGKKLSLFGDPRISGLQIKLGKNSNGLYFLEYRGNLYSLDVTRTKKELNQIARPYDFKTVLEEELEIEIHSLFTNAKPSQDLIVKVASGASLKNEYYFTEQNGKKVLFVDSNMDIDKMKVVAISKEEGDAYYLIHNTTLYQIEAHTAQMTPLKELDFTANTETRMLMERPSFASKVYPLSFPE
ncbi:hypothetical protein [Flagellimonas allohymeniacidonis]|uniref:Uncharacterized protein n=1 Tax=Flagellimonas allohymeniacidonis TaxID=2517819 RepID=A0A4Q8QDY3_9FLAO|nr:hypothetical protein [Allomuricauda hymeniacidonis]TAI47338.1 hypothetical protein EW142_11705 [Allomuricauda hymeniacidonis]